MTRVKLTYIQTEILKQYEFGSLKLCADWLEINPKIVYDFFVRNPDKITYVPDNKEYMITKLKE